MQLRLEAASGVHPGQARIHFSKTPFSSKFLQHPGDVLEMLARFVFDAALGVAAVVSGIAIAAATAW